MRPGRASKSENEMKTLQQLCDNDRRGEMRQVAWGPGIGSY